MLDVDDLVRSLRGWDGGPMIVTDDEWDRLTKEYGELPEYGVVADALTRLKEENERLRAALQSLYDEEWRDDDDPILEAARMKAFAALRPKA